MNGEFCAAGPEGVQQIYPGSGMCPALGVVVSGPGKGWIVFKHADGMWVTAGKPDETPEAAETAQILAALEASPTLKAVALERLRQVEVEGFDADHDNQHELGEIESAGIAYMMASGMIATHGRILYRPRSWPWEASWWKPVACAFRNRVKGIALLCAEGDAQLRRKTGGGA